MKRLITAIAIATVGLAGCKKSEESPSKTPDPSTGGKAVSNGDTKKSITIYSGRSEKLVKPVLDAFQKSSGIEVVVKYAGTAELAAALLDEGDKSPADVFIAQDASTLERDRTLRVERHLLPTAEFMDSFDSNGRLTRQELARYVSRSVKS